VSGLRQLKRRVGRRQMAEAGEESHQGGGGLGKGRWRWLGWWRDRRRLAADLEVALGTWGVDRVLGFGCVGCVLDLGVGCV
jgi:hypothetical protein